MVNLKHNLVISPCIISTPITQTQIAFSFVLGTKNEALLELAEIKDSMLQAMMMAMNEDLAFSEIARQYFQKIYLEADYQYRELLSEQEEEGELD